MSKEQQASVLVLTGFLLTFWGVAYFNLNHEKTAKKQINTAHDLGETNLLIKALIEK
jgi:hypothetical protein